MEESDLTPTFSVVKGKKKKKKKERAYFVCNKTVIYTVEATYANKLTRYWILFFQESEQIKLSMAM